MTNITMTNFIGGNVRDPSLLNTLVANMSVVNLQLNVKVWTNIWDLPRLIKFKFDLFQIGDFDEWLIWIVEYIFSAIFEVGNFQFS